MKKLSLCKDDKTILGAVAVLSACLAFFVLLLLFVGTTDYNDGEIEERIYCEHVRDNVWPDYKGLYNEVCRKYEDGKLLKAPTKDRSALRILSRSPELRNPAHQHQFQIRASV